MIRFPFEEEAGRTLPRSVRLPLAFLAVGFCKGLIKVANGLTNWAEREFDGLDHESWCMYINIQYIPDVGYIVLYIHTASVEHTNIRSAKSRFRLKSRI